MTTFQLKDLPEDVKAFIRVMRENMEVTIEDNGDESVWMITPKKDKKPSGKRIPELHKGTMWISDDFDEPLPDEFWLGKDL